MKEHFLAILNSYSEIFFIRGLIPGILMFAITLVNPNVAVAGLISVVAAYLFARFIRLDKTFLESGFYTYNPLLVGLSIGYLFQITTFTILLVIFAGVLTFVLTIALFNFTSYYLRLPVLSLPFVIVSSLAWMASSRYSNLYVNSMYPQYTLQLEDHVPVWIAGFLKSVGSILFLPDVLSGLVFLLIILAVSRIMFFLAVSGYYAGTLLKVIMTGSVLQAFGDINNFNFILIAIVIGGVFLVPSPRSYILALTAVLSSTLLLDSVEVFWANYGVPVFTLPFNLVSLSFIYVMGLVKYPMMTPYIRKTPEDSLDDFLSNHHRFRDTEHTLTLPFSGKWTVWQGFDGEWTHKGSWRYAYDFVITNDNGDTFSGDGGRPEDYFAFGKPVLSPVRGRVMEVISHLPDNAIGDVDRTNNWGNLVVISDPRGFFVELSHFKKDSIKVTAGQWVERGTFLGMCGNSGYSPQPHIHVQAQSVETIGASTLPFTFVSYRSGDTFHANHLPAVKEKVEPVYADKSVELRTTFILDQEFKYRLYRDDQYVQDWAFTVRMAPDSTFYFDSGKGKLYFGKKEGTFYFYHLEGDDWLLRRLFLAMPRLPLTGQTGIEWSDYIPVGILTAGWKKAALLFVSSFYHGFARVDARMSLQSGRKISGRIHSNILKLDTSTEVEFDDTPGLARIRVDNLELRRMQEENNEN